jgi:hypothetical protein
MTTYGWHIASVPAPPPVPGSDFHGWKVTYAGWNPCIEWCKDQFGDMVWPGPHAVWHHLGEGVFEFKNDADRMLFLLTWG